MTTHLYCQIKNEAFILPYFLKHYNWVDKIFLYDNFSTDASRAIANTVENVTIMPHSGKEPFDEVDLQTFKNEIWKQSLGIADYVIVCDADEFLVVPGIKRYETRAYLQALADTGVHIPQVTKGYEMVSIHTYLKHKFLVESIRLGVEAPLYAKQIIFSPNIDSIGYAIGAHTADPKGQNLLRGGNLSLWHYKYIGGVARLLQHYQDREKGVSEAQKQNKFATQWYRTREELARDYKALYEQAKQLDN
jgi:Glycosyl transferase family 2